MKKKKDMIMNIEPFDSEMRTYEGGFEWIFRAPFGEDYSRNKIIKMKFPRWWVIYLAQELKKVVEFEKQELQRIINQTGFKND